MSRIGKKLIEIPKDVSIQFENKIITVKGKHGVLYREILAILNLEIQAKTLSITRNDDTKKSREYHGLMRALIQNMVSGVDQLFSKLLIAEGVGYKFQLIQKENNQKILVLNVGFTHPVEFLIPNDINVKLESPTRVLISGIDKEKVGFLAAKIREMRPPEPYKGKGILYDQEKIIRKAGKTGK